VQTSIINIIIFINNNNELPAIALSGSNFVYNRVLVVSKRLRRQSANGSTIKFN